MRTPLAVWAVAAALSPSHWDDNISACFGFGVTDKNCSYFIQMSVNTGGMTGKLTFGKGTQVSIVSVIQDPNPSVYQLRSPKSSSTSVCLYTDFKYAANVSKAERSMVLNSSSTVLDMGAIGSKSNGVVAWSNSTDFECEDTFNETFYSNLGIPCNAKLVEQSFETDMNLNFQNLLVIGFRVLLLKVVGFNLLMTLRLWSS